MSALAWLERAQCIGSDPELWFPVSDTPDAYQPARDICETCPVRLECLEWAISGGIRHGMFGGKTPSQRESYRQKHRLSVTRQGPVLEPCGTSAAYARHYRAGEPACEACRQWNALNKRAG